MKMRFDPHLSSCVRTRMLPFKHSTQFSKREEKKTTNSNKTLTHRIEKFIKTHQIGLRNTHAHIHNYLPLFLASIALHRKYKSTNSSSQQATIWEKKWVKSKKQRIERTENGGGKKNGRRDGALVFCLPWAPENMIKIIERTYSIATVCCCCFSIEWWWWWCCCCCCTVKCNICKIGYQVVATSTRATVPARMQPNPPEVIMICNYYSMCISAVDESNNIAVFFLSSPSRFAQFVSLLYV